MSRFDLIRRKLLRLGLMAVAICASQSAAFAAGLGQTASAVEAGAQREKMRSQIDISKIQWPSPPALPRIQMLADIAGEPESVRPPREERKLSWKERMSGFRTSPPPNRQARRLVSPYGTAIDSDGRIYAADSGSHAIAIFDQNGKNFSWYTSAIVFKNIAGIALDDRDRLFVTDTDSRRVIILSSSGTPVGTFGSNHLVRPAGAAIDTLYRQLYVADPAQDRVAVFDIDTLEFIRFIGTPSNGKANLRPGVLNKPTNVAVGPDSRLYVSDTLNSRIQVFDNRGTFLRRIGRLGSGPGTLYRPKGIAVDCDGHIWVADTGQSRVQVFDQQGHLLAYFGHRGELPGEFVLPSGLSIDRQNRVIISDQGSGRVQVFRYVTDSEVAATKKSRHEAAADRLLSHAQH